MTRWAAFATVRLIGPAAPRRTVTDMISVVVRRGPRLRRLLGVAVALASTALAAGVTDGASALPHGVPATGSACAGDAPVPVRELQSLQGCDLTGRVVFEGPVAVTVPPPGLGVAASAAAAAGVEASLSVENRAGRLRVSSRPATGGPAGDADRSTSRPPPKCSDKSYKLAYGGHPWAGTLAWSYKSSTTPDHWQALDAVSAIAAGGRTMARGGNSCNLRSRVDASIDYLGTTQASPSIDSSSARTTCGTPNTANVVAWGELAGDNLAFTCYWWSSRSMVGADILLEDTTQIVRGVTRDCEDDLDLQALATHEWGHAFGLDHVSQRHANLVMPHLVATCSVSDRLLGLGDYNGLKRLYGTR